MSIDPAEPVDPAGLVDPAARRLRVLLSAYACGPGDEPEASAGWAIASAAAVEHDVWVITRRRFKSTIDAKLAADPELSKHLSMIYTDLSDRILKRKRTGRDVYWYYALWQRHIGALASALHADTPFDVLHHTTFAVDWLPCGLLKVVDVPLVWGPVGGATYAPWRLVRWLGFRGAIGEIVRGSSTRIGRRLWGDPVARRAAVVVGQNPDQAKRFSYARRNVTEANAAFFEEPAEFPGSQADTKSAIFVGRLVSWKGPRLALAALARPELADWTLDIYGSGRDAQYLKQQARKLGIAHRVQFKGHQPRAEVLLAYSRADAMIFPSTHDSAAWVVGEASAAGCPVVCLNIGGPPLLAGPNAFAVEPGRNVVVDLARALSAAGAKRGIRYQRWSADRLPALLRDWYGDAVRSAAQ